MGQIGTLPVAAAWTRSKGGRLGAAGVIGGRRTQGLARKVEQLRVRRCRADRAVPLGRQRARPHLAMGGEVINICPRPSARAQLLL
jgi:hypothetical protein